ncbi:MAG: MFS transporter, partial [Candidatus Bathyarchaeota archaeon]
MTHTAIPQSVFFLTALELSLAMSMYITQPIFPLHVKALGASTFEIGLLVTVASVVTLFARIPISILSDRVGRWPIIPFGLCSISISLSLFALAPSLIWIFPLQAVRAAVGSGYMPTTHAITSDLAPPNRRAETLAFVLTAVGLGSMLGPTLCSVLVGYLSYSQIFLVAASLPFLGFIAYLLGKTWITRSPTAKPAQEGAVKKPLSFIAVLRLQHVMNLCYYEFAFQVAEGAFATLFVIYAEGQLLFTASLISLLFAIRGLANTVIRIPAGKVADRIGRRYPFYLAAILLTITFLALAVVQTFLTLSFTMLIYGVGFGMYKVLSNTLFVENVPPENKVVSLSLRFTAMGI